MISHLISKGSGVINGDLPSYPSTYHVCVGEKKEYRGHKTLTTCSVELAESTAVKRTTESQPTFRTLFAPRRNPCADTARLSVAQGGYEHSQCHK